jgi:hypothetical protein
MVPMPSDLYSIVIATLSPSCPGHRRDRHRHRQWNIHTSEFSCPQTGMRTSRCWGELGAGSMYPCYTHTHTHTYTHTYDQCPIDSRAHSATMRCVECGMTREKERVYDTQECETCAGMCLPTRGRISALDIFAFSLS